MDIGSVVLGLAIIGAVLTFGNILRRRWFSPSRPFMDVLGADEE